MAEMLHRSTSRRIAGTQRAGLYSSARGVGLLNDENALRMSRQCPPKRFPLPDATTATSQRRVSTGLFTSFYARFGKSDRKGGPRNGSLPGQMS